MFSLRLAARTLDGSATQLASSDCPFAAWVRTQSAGDRGALHADSGCAQASGASTTAELCPPMPSEVFSVSAPGSMAVGPSSNRG